MTPVVEHHRIEAETGGGGVNPTTNGDETVNHDGDDDGLPELLDIDTEETIRPVDPEA